MLTASPNVRRRRHRYCQVFSLSGGSILVEKVISGLGAVSAHGSNGSTAFMDLLGFTSPV